MKIQENYPLKAYNTFGFDVQARYYAAPSTVGELKTLLSNPAYKQLPKLVLGGGSNLLFRGNFEGLVIHPQFIHELHEFTRKSKKISHRSHRLNLLQKICVNLCNLWENKYVFVTAGAGVNWDDLVAHCVNNGWGGLENLSGIPGNVGAAPVQNIGAYGVEVKDCIERVDAIRLDTLEDIFFTNSECHFGYRDSIFKQEWKNKLLITQVVFKLSLKPELKTHYGALCEVLQQYPTVGIQQVREAVMKIREQKLPDHTEIGNAGSFFKNPTVAKAIADQLQSQYPKLTVYPVDAQHTKIPAGWLIEQSGWKGKRVGNVGVHTAQALVLVNYGTGTGEEVLQLAKAIQQSVLEKFNIQLELEVNVV